MPTHSFIQVGLMMDTTIIGAIGQKEATTIGKLKPLLLGI